MSPRVIPKGVHESINLYKVVRKKSDRRADIQFWTRDVGSTISNVTMAASRRELPTAGASKVIYVFGVAFALYHLFALGIWRTQPMGVHIAVHLLTVLIFGFLVYSHSTKKATKLPLIDVILILLSSAAIVYFIVNIDRIHARTWQMVTPLSTLDIFFGTLLLLLILEAARRAVGLIFVAIIVCFLLVMYFGPYLPGIWAHEGFSFIEILDSTIFAFEQGIWGIPLQISSTLIILFFIFGKLMQHCGVGDLIMSLAQAVSGGARGGPAKVAVVGSGFIGSVTSGPATNIVMTGTFTIPMMIKTGYKPHYAGAVEAAASTGASIVPPVMTGIIFIMAELTATPVVTLMMLAILPALFYYVCILLQVHFEAIRLGMTAGRVGVSLKEISQILKERGHLLLPIVLLIVLLLLGYYVVMAVIWSILAVVLVAAIRKKTRIGPKRIMTALNEATREVALVGVACALSGIILISLFHTGLHSTLSHEVNSAAGGSLLLLCLIGGFACLIMGMGLPAIAAYLLTVLVVAPIMMKAGLPTLVAHFFSLYYANIAYITPPIAIGAYVAAGIAGASFWRVGFTAVRLASAGFIIPILLVYRPALLMFGSPLEIIWAIIASIIIVVCLASALEGWQLKRLNIFERILLLGAGCALILPNLLVNIGAIILVGLVLVWQVREKVMPRIYKPTADRK